MDVVGSAGGLMGWLASNIWWLPVYLVAFVGVLSVVVFVHEYGHFIVGRWCGVGVTAFSIGFGPELFGWTDRRGTRWRVAAIPLGGYVKFVGDMNGASVPDQDTLDHMGAAERAQSFHHKPVWKRMAIVAAGPIANFLFAILIFAAVVSINGRDVLAPRVDLIQPNSAAARAGFQPGDVILSIDGRVVGSFDELRRYVGPRADQQLTVVVDRGGVPVTLTATPDLQVSRTSFGTQRIGLLGLQASTDKAYQRHIAYNPVEALGFGVGEVSYIVERTFDYIAKLVSGRESADQLSGPIRIAQVSGTVAVNGGLGGLINLVAVISVSIGLINLFPIPLLDGGHLVFYAIEAVRGRPLSDRAQEIGFRIGFGIVVMLMLFTVWNDIAQIGWSIANRAS